MDEDNDFIALEDPDDDLIEFAPAPKRLKRLKPENATKNAAAPAKTPKKRSKDVETDEYDGVEITKPKAKAKRTTKAKQVELSSPKAMITDEPVMEAPQEDVDFEDVQWEDVEGEGAAEGENVPNPASGASVAEKHEFDIHMAVDKDDTEESAQKNQKKRKRESTGPKKRRGSQKERDEALNYHNMHLLCWIAHAIHLRKQTETNTLYQALMVSLLPLELFEEIALAFSTSKRVAEAVLNLVTWFHNFFYIVEPLTAPNRVPVAAPTIDLTLEDDDDSEHNAKGKKRKNKLDKAPSDENEPYRGLVHRRFGPFLFSAPERPVVVSQALAFRAFTTLLEALQIPHRPVWYFDKLVVPSKFSDLTLVRPKTPFSLHHWTIMINKALSMTLGEHGHPEQGGKIAKKKVPVEAPFMWVEIFSGDKDRWLPLDVFRKQLDRPEIWNVTITEDEKRKTPKAKFGTTDCAYIIAIGPNGKLTHVSPRYARTYSEPMMKVGDAEWFVSLLADWNSHVSGAHLLPSQNVDNRLESIMEKSERNEMSDIAASEGFPKTLDAYKHHPLYVLERNLLKFEVLRPDHSPPIHKVGENDVYLRKDVSLIHTSDKWIQLGIQVKEGEQPVSKMIKRSQVNWDNAKKTWVDESEAEMSEYFGDWQVEHFAPPVARNGLVPKNRYGNVYLFKPSMLPIGCVHLTGYPHLDKSARKIGVDVAPAMVGWLVEGYWSTPELDGWVICEDKAEMAIEAWHADTAKREADQFKKIRDRAAQHWLNLTKQLLLKTRMDSVHGDKSETAATNKKTTETGQEFAAPLAGNEADAATDQKAELKEKQHTHTFPEELTTKDEKGTITRKCKCGYVDSVQRL